MSGGNHASGGVLNALKEEKEEERKERKKGRGRKFLNLLPQYKRDKRRSKATNIGNEHVYILLDFMIITSDD